MSAASAAPGGRATIAQAGMELRLTLRRGENLLVTIVVPLALLLFFGSVTIVPGLGDRPIDFLVPGILALAVIATSMVNLGIATAYERAYGVLKRLGATPLTRGGLVAAKIAAILVVEAVQVAAVVAVAAAAFGWRPDEGWQPAVVAAALGLGTLAFAGLGLLMAGSLRAEATLAGANALFVVFLLLGGIVVPIDQLPGLLAALAHLLPAAALSTALRAGLSGGAGDVGGALVLLAAWGAGTSLAAARWFRWE